MTRFLAGLSFLALALSTLSAGAQTEEVLTSIEAVKGLKIDDASRHPQTVKLRGVVTHVNVDKTLVTLNDGGQGIGVSLEKGLTCPALADDIEVEGRTVIHIVAGHSHPRVLAAAIRVVGKGKLPAPTKLDIPTLNKFANYEQWVSIEAQVTRWQYRPVLQELDLVLLHGGVWTRATILTPTRPAFADQLVGATLRLAGINAGRTTHDANGAMIIPSVAQVEMIKPGWKSPFDAPMVSMRDASQGRVPLESRVKVRGIVVKYKPGSLEIMLRGADGALVIGLEKSWDRTTAPGDEFVDAGPWPIKIAKDDEVEAVFTLSPSGYRYAIGDVRVIGRGTPAPPEPVSIETLQAYENKDDWVSVETTVASWAQKGSSMYFHTQSAEDWLFFIVPDMAVFPQNLYGARIRVTGITHRNGSLTSFYIPGPDYFEVLAPGKADWHDFPKHSAAEIVHDRISLGEPVVTEGVLIGQQDGTLHVRGDDGALCVHLMNLWPRNQGFSRIEDGGVHPELSVGDRVQISGAAIRPHRREFFKSFDLAHAHVRVIGKADKVEPVDTTFTRILAGEHASDLVRVRGRLLTWQHAPLDNGVWRTTMLLKADGQKLAAVHESKVLNPYNTLKLDDEVLLQGVVKKAVLDRPPQLWIYSPADAKSLGVSPEVTTNRLWIGGGSAAGLLVLFSGWIIALRRSNRAKTETALDLEQRVNERTAELQQAQTDLSKALEQERELSELKSRFVSMVSHEFRTPLGVTMSAIEILRRMDDKLDSEHKRELHDDIVSSTRHMAGLMEQVLLIGRVEAGKLGFKPLPCDLDALVARLIDEALSATHRKCPIRLESTQEIAGAAADESLLRHVLSNLINNAAKYSPAGSEVLITVRREGINAVFEITDHGIGIPEKAIPHLFEAFHRADNVGDIPGTGLGLVIVKRCTELHGGSISVNSAVGEGTTFTVKLPLFPL